MFAPKVAKPQTKGSTLPSQRASNLTWHEPGGEQEHEVDLESTTVRQTPRVSWSFSKIRVDPPDSPTRSQPSRPIIPTPLPGGTQAKLAVGSVDGSARA
jgi:hypothetical protein